MDNKIKANLALFASAVGAAVTIPAFSPLTAAMSAFSLGLANHAFTAATIGGLADWFAVTALFRKPLGFISYRTEILKRNRARIMDAIIDFVSNDLLSANNIISNLKSENTANLLINYLEHGGRDKVKILANEILFEASIAVDSKSLAKSLAPIISDHAQTIDSKEIIQNVIKVLTKDSHSRKILSMLFDSILKIFHSEAIQEALKVKITDIKRDYEGDSSGRAFVLAAVDLTENKILSIINDNVDKKINGTIKTLNSDGILDPDTITTAANLCLYFKNFVESTTSDDKSGKFFNDVKSVLTSNFDLVGYLQKFLDSFLKGDAFLKNQQILKNATSDAHSSQIIKLEAVRLPWENSVNDLVDSKIDTFLQSPIQQAEFDKFIKNFLEKIINKHHNAISDLIRERLNELSDEDLTTFVEGKVSDDLQMIRINGAVCGGIVGILLYLVSYVFEFSIPH